MRNDQHVVFNFLSSHFMSAGIGVASLLLISANANAVNKCVGKEGNVSYQTEKCPNDARQQSVGNLKQSSESSDDRELLPALVAMQKGDYAKALQIFETLSKQGHAKAQVSLGTMYVNGRGVKQDYATALKLFEQAAKQGDLLALHNLGSMYSKGRGVPQNDTTALEFYRKAAEQGAAMSQEVVGEYYYLGKATPQNYQIAKNWLEKAATQGNAAAMYNLGVMNANGQGVDKNFAAARSWFQKAVTAGEKSDPSTAAQAKMMLMKLPQ